MVWTISRSLNTIPAPALQKAAPDQNMAINDNRTVFL